MGKVDFNTNISYNPFVEKTGAVGPKSTQGTGRTSYAPAFGNSKINSADMQDFMANIGNCNPNKPACKNNNPYAGALCGFEITA